MADRLSARLASAGLSPEQLLAFIEEQAPLWSDAALRVAEEHAETYVARSTNPADRAILLFFPFGRGCSARRQSSG